MTGIPRADDESGQLNSTRWLEDGSFIRLSNVSLSYSVPASLTERLKMTDLTLSLRSVNLFTFTAFTGFNPDTGFFEEDDYPINRTITFGLSAKF